MDHPLGQLEPPDVAGRDSIAAWIERSVDDTDLTPGQRLPTVRALAAHLDVSTATVAGAYRTLLERGLTVSEGRRGTFVAPRSIRPRTTSAPTTGLLDLTTGAPDPALLPDLGAILPHLRVPHTTYGSHPVLAELRRVGGRVLDQDGITGGDPLVLSGALDAIERALDAWLRPGDGVAVEDPGWTATVDLVRAMRLRPVPVAIDDRGMLPAALAAAVDEVRAVVITPRYQNPTGSVMDEERAATLREVVGAVQDLLVVQDDHAGLITGAPLADITSASPTWLHVQSMSKSLGPDLRVAIARGDAQTADRVAARQSVGAGWVSTLLQQVVVDLLEDPGTPALLDRAHDAYRGRREALLRALEVRSVAATGRSGLNVWVPVPDEAAVVAAVRDVGVAILGGQRFRVHAPPAVRISTAQLPLDRVDEIADAMARATQVGSRGRHV